MHYIGIDVHKRICTAVVSDDNENVIDQIVDFETGDQGLSCITDRYAPDDCRIIIENLTTAHRVYHWFKGRGYTIEELCRIVVAIAAEFGILRVCLFGSRARSDNRPDSDCDFCFKTSDIMGLLKLGGFYGELEDAL